MYMQILCAFTRIVFFLDIFQYAYSSLSINGRYTRNIQKYQVAIPRKVSKNGEFVSFKIPHFFEHNFKGRTRKRSMEDPNLLHYSVFFNGAKHHIDLWPNHHFISPNLVIERRSPRTKVSQRKLESLQNKICHYTGRVRDDPKSRVALSTCDGLVGYIITTDGKYFIEPIEEHVANVQGHHAHLIYERRAHFNEHGNQCGTNGSWEDAWRERLRREYRTKFRHKRESEKRGFRSLHRYLETLIVCDKKFLEHHKNSDYQTYILTIMNMVADFYHDATSGNQMDVVVVRMIYLEKEEEEIDLIINPNSEDTLASFCKWQRTVNPKDIKNPNHHDIAVLLTRHDICADQGANCGLMGLAYVATACESDKSCAINEDGGLNLGIVVAHEMGHVMGCSHDIETDSGCKPQDDDGSYYVMAPYIHMDTSRWSTCSRGYITTLFNNDLGECLNDEPESTRFQLPNMLPGAMYDAEYQCRITFPGSTVCGALGEKMCERLVCRTSPDTCMSDGEPPADGTKCGEGKWCFKRKCVESGKRPAAVNGGWGEWSSWSTCSRTCGGGVMYSERDCNNPEPKFKGRYCLGERKRVQICNTEPCKEGSKSYRAVQCTEFDNKPFQDKLFKWEPFFVEKEPCVLYCVNSNNVFSKMAPMAKDGTPCKSGTKNMCINGVCKKVGCDYVLDSSAIEDECGICKGDGTQCKKIEETYVDPPGHGYVKVKMIPKGARKIEVDELRPSGNSIAISAADEKTFYLNGDFTEQVDGGFDMGGVEAVYNHPEVDKEKVVAEGPLKEDIVVFVVFYESDNGGYSIKYNVPTTQDTYQPKYHWEFTDWADCSVRCGGGVEIAEPECVEENAGKVTSSFCVGIEKPPIKERKCNEEPCKTKWRVGKWGKCTACKFQSGVRIREVECVKEAAVPGEEDVLEDDSKCKGPRPGTRELCNSHKTCPKTKRYVDGIPANVLQHLWLQAFEDYIFEKLPELQDQFKSLRKTDENCSTSDNKKQPKLNVGKIIDDKAPPEEIKLIEYPLKQSHTSINLTDQSFETMGDKIGDTVDVCKAKVFSGNEAAKILKEFQNENKTEKTP